MTREPVTFHTGFDRWMALMIAVALGPGAVIGWLVPKARFVQLTVAAYLLFACWYLYRHTYYTFGDDALHVHFGPLTADIPYGSMHRAALSYGAKAGYAMSLDRVVIEFGDGDSILISPDDRSAFLDELHGRAPFAIIDRAGSAAPA